MLHTYSLDQAKNAQNVTKSQHQIKVQVILSLYSFLLLYRLELFITSTSII